MINFLKALITFIQMYFEGFYFSKNTHKDKKSKWGSYYFNWKNEISLYYVDFSFSKNKNNESYFHIHGSDFRFHFGGEKELIRQKLVPSIPQMEICKKSFNKGWNCRKHLYRIEANPFVERSLEYYSWNMGWLAGDSVFNETDQNDIL